MKPKTANNVSLIILLLIMLSLFFIPFIESRIFAIIICVLSVVGAIVATAINIIYKRCPHCHKFLGRSLNKYCSHCGKEIE